MTDGRIKLAVRIGVTGILGLAVVLSFTIGIVGLEKICPNECCQSISSDIRAWFPFLLVSVMEICTVLFIVQAFRMLYSRHSYSDDMHKNGDYPYGEFCMGLNSWSALIAFGIVFVINICIWVGFSVAGTPYSYGALKWLLLSKCVIAGGTICWAWYPFGYVKGYERVGNATDNDTDNGADENEQV